MLLLSRWRQAERMWDFVPEEAASILAGRDLVGLKLAREPVEEHALSAACIVVFSALALLVGYATGSYLTTTDAINPNAVPAVALLSALAAHAILGFVRDQLKVPKIDPHRSATVEPVVVPAEELDTPGLAVRGLTVFENGGKTLLSDVSWSIAPGSVLGVDGESGAGKSLLQSVIVDPFSLENVQIRGNIRLNGADLWQRDSKGGIVPVVHVDCDPILLPATGAENVSCFHEGPILEQAKRNLERLVFSNELVEEVCAAPDASRLPSMQRKALAMARAFTLSPSLYLFDRPEDGLPEKQISALIGRIETEVRLGRSFVMITQNRALLGLCDKILVLQSGQVVDFGTAEEIRNLKASGWARFASERSLEIEENLESWVRSHFKRPGDEANARRVSHIAAEMLAFSCRGNDGLDARRNLIFEFKHFKGHCILRMQDNDPPITSSTITKAEEEAATPNEGVRLSPLASVISNALEIECGIELDRRVLSVKIGTYDPRLGTRQESNAAAKA
ncbi:MAG: ATP-binding cassette domain-containing protein [Pseudomonadota bacterium]